MAGVLSIDPGAVSAAWAFRPSAFQDTQVGDVPVVDGNVDALNFAALVRRLGPHVAIVEQVASMPSQGVASTFKFGKGCGLILGVLAALGVPLVTVAASRWKKALKLPGKDKEPARALALKLFPALAAQLQRKKDAGRAEALLLGQWYIIHYVDETI